MPGGSGVPCGEGEVRGRKEGSCRAGLGGSVGSRVGGQRYLAAQVAYQGRGPFGPGWWHASRTSRRVLRATSHGPGPSSGMRMAKAEPSPTVLLATTSPPWARRHRYEDETKR